MTATVAASSWLRPRTLAQKRVRLIVAAIVYVAVAGTCIGIERVRLLNAMEKLEDMYVHDEVLVRAVVAVSQAAHEVTGATYGAADVSVRPEAFEAIETARVALARLGEVHPPAAHWGRALGDRVKATRENDAPRSSWILLRELIRDVRSELTAHRGSMMERIEAQRLRVRRTYDLITLTWVIIGALGVIGVAIVAGGFFTRLTKDLGRLERRAGEIVAGYRGAPLDLARDDEVQNLAAAVNRMSDDLRQREAKLALDEQRRAYDEKMTALRALAAGMSHEVNNPLTEIAAIAEELAAEARKRGDADVAERALSILSDVRRASAATGRLAMLAVPQPSAPEWIDFNELVRRTAGLLFYDPRFRRIALDLNADPDLPAVNTAPALLQQALFDLVVGAADTLGNGGGRLTLRTRSADERVRLEIAVATEAAPDLHRARTIASALHGALHARAGPEGLALALALPLDAFSSPSS